MGVRSRPWGSIPKKTTAMMHSKKKRKKKEARRWSLAVTARPAPFFVFFVFLSLASATAAGSPPSRPAASGTAQRTTCPTRRRRRRRPTKKRVEYRSIHTTRYRRKKFLSPPSLFPPRSSSFFASTWDGGGGGGGIASFPQAKHHDGKKEDAKERKKREKAKNGPTWKDAFACALRRWMCGAWWYSPPYVDGGKTLVARLSPASNLEEGDDYRGDEDGDDADVQGGGIPKPNEESGRPRTREKEEAEEENGACVRVGHRPTHAHHLVFHDSHGGRKQQSQKKKKTLSSDARASLQRMGDHSSCYTDDHGYYDYYYPLPPPPLRRNKKKVLHGVVAPHSSGEGHGKPKKSSHFFSHPCLLLGFSPACFLRSYGVRWSGGGGWWRFPPPFPVTHVPPLFRTCTRDWMNDERRRAPGDGGAACRAPRGLASPPLPRLDDWASLAFDPAPFHGRRWCT